VHLEGVTHHTHLPAIQSSVPSIGGALASGTTPSLVLSKSIGLPVEQLGSMPPLDLFLKQVGCESAEARVDAMKRLSVVGMAIGPQQTLAELLPWIATHIVGMSNGGGDVLQDGDNDEILYILADQLGLLVPTLIPGPKALGLVELLEKLANAEETVVRDMAVASINKIVPLLLKGDKKDVQAVAKQDQAPQLLLATAKRLATADWFTPKVSAAGVLPAIYAFFVQHAALSPSDDPASPDAQAKRELRLLYKELCQDETPMVRRSAAKHLGAFVEALESKDIVHEEMISLYHALAKDEQDSVRLLSVAASGSIGIGLDRSPDDTAELILPVVQAGSVDLSWRVRHNLAKVFSKVAANLGYSDSPVHAAQQTELFTFFASLLQDAEAEVRASAVQNLARMAQLGTPELFTTHLAPVLPALADDPVMEVRSKLAQALMDCCDETICTTLNDRIILAVFKPLLEGFLNDEFAEVQLHILTKLARVSHLLGKMDVVVSSILQMTKAQNWRVREAVARLLPHLAHARGLSFFEDHLLEPWLKLLLDQVADVRSACVDGMSKLLEVAGAAWMQREILPHYVRIYDEALSTSYLTRVTILRSYAALAVVDIATPALLDDVVNQMLRGLDDRVANVRMVAARSLASISQLLESAILQTKVKPALVARVTDDEDDDCKFFAQTALDACA